MSAITAPEEKRNGTVSILIEDGQGRVLLQLRDEKPSIPYPGCWSTLGGSIEEGETPLEAARRELEEETGLTYEHMRYAGAHFVDGEYPIHLFIVKDEHLDPGKIDLREGQRVKFMGREDIMGEPFAFHLDRLIKDFYGW